MGRTKEDLAALAAADDADITAPQFDDDVEALERELAEERRKLEALDVDEASPGARREALRAELEEVKRKTREKKALTEAKAKYGRVGKDIEAVDTIGGMVIVKRGDGMKVRRWQDSIGKKITHDQLRQLARPCVVYPPLDAFDALVAEHPVIMPAIASAVLRLSGLRVKQIGGK